MWTRSLESVFIYAELNLHFTSSQYFVRLLSLKCIYITESYFILFVNLQGLACCATECPSMPFLFSRKYSHFYRVWWAVCTLLVFFSLYKYARVSFYFGRCLTSCFCKESTTRCCFSYELLFIFWSKSGELYLNVNCVCVCLFLRNHSESEIKWICDLFWLTNVKRFLILQVLKRRIIFNLKYLSPPYGSKNENIDLSWLLQSSFVALYCILFCLHSLCRVIFPGYFYIFCISKVGVSGSKFVLTDCTEKSKENNQAYYFFNAKWFSLVMNTLVSFVLLPKRPEDPLRTPLMLL